MSIPCHKVGETIDFEIDDGAGTSGTAIITAIIDDDGNSVADRDDLDEYDYLYVCQIIDYEGDVLAHISDPERRAEMVIGLNEFEVRPAKTILVSASEIQINLEDSI